MLELEEAINVHNAAIVADSSSAGWKGRVRNNCRFRTDKQALYS